MQIDTSTDDPALQPAVSVAFLSQALHGEQLIPVPKYPALQAQDDVSEDVNPVQTPDVVACWSQVLHGEQLVPVP